jgi:hypothetical protein
MQHLSAANYIKRNYFLFIASFKNIVSVTFLLIL